MSLPDVLFITSSVLSAIATVLFAKRAGDRWSMLYWDEQLERIGIIIVLCGVFVGLYSRAMETPPTVVTEDNIFTWYHWIVLIGSFISVAGYSHVIRRGRYQHAGDAIEIALLDIEKWLDIVETLDDCPTEGCQYIRSEMRNLNSRLRRGG